ncbi:MAG: hypothetical protein EBZ77_11450, partial [Chitinophagia bacterium]|nr:hypothetical protein [Chitinophagia bacterium]
LQEIGNHYSNGQNTQQQLSTPQFTHYAAASANGSAIPDVAAFWKAQFASGIPNMHLLSTSVRNSETAWASQCKNYKLPSALLATLKEQAAAAGVTFFTALFATLEICLQAGGPADGIVLGLSIAGQANGLAPDAVGCYGQLLPIRSNYTGNSTFRNYLAQCNRRLLMARENADIPFMELLTLVGAERLPNRYPLAPVVVESVMDIDKRLYLNNLHHNTTWAATDNLPYEMLVRVTGSEADCTIEWHYRKALYTNQFVDNLLQRMGRLLNVVAANNQSRIEECLPATALVAEPPAPASRMPVSSFDGNYTLVDMFSEWAHNDPEKSAVVFTERSVSYRYMHEKSSKIVAWLQSIGVEPGVVVAVMLEPSPDVVIAILAILKAGAAFVPVDSSFPQAMLEQAFSDSGVQFLYTAQAFESRWPAGVSVVLQEDAWKKALDFAQMPELPQISGDWPARIAYVAGEATRPAGVVTTHKNLAHLVQAVRQSPGFNANGRFLCAHPLHDTLSISEMLVPLAIGATVVMLDPLIAHTPRLINSWIKTQQITHIQARPPFFEGLLAASADMYAKTTAICFTHHSELPIAPELLRRFAAAWQVYGPAEATGHATIKKLDRTPQTGIGKPFQNTQVYMLDEHHNALPTGTEGRVYLGGSNIAAGYCNDTDLSARFFAPDPFGVASSLVFDTGKYGHLSESGVLTFSDADAGQIEREGYHFLPDGLARLLATLPGINGAAVV